MALLSLNRKFQDDGKITFSISPQVGNRQKAVFDDNDRRRNRQIAVFDGNRGVGNRQINLFDKNRGGGNRQIDLFDGNRGVGSRQINLFDAVRGVRSRQKAVFDGNRGVGSRLEDVDMNSRGLSSPRYYNVRILVASVKTRIGNSHRTSASSRRHFFFLSIFPRVQEPAAIRPSGFASLQTLFILFSYVPQVKKRGYLYSRLYRRFFERL